MVEVAEAAVVDYLMQSLEPAGDADEVVEDAAEAEEVCWVSNLSRSSWVSF